MIKITLNHLLALFTLAIVGILLAYYNQPPQKRPIKHGHFTVIYKNEPGSMNISNPKLDDLEFERGGPFLEIFKERRQQLSKACEQQIQYKPGRGDVQLNELVNLFEAQPAVLQHLQVDDKNGIIFCRVPKVASSTWAKVLALLAANELPFLNNFTRPEEISDSLVNNGKVWNKLTPIKPMSNFTKAQRSVRLKKYKKFMWVRHPLIRLVSAWRSKLAASDNIYYLKVFGSQILKKYRPNASKNETAEGKGVTLEEFLRYLVDLPRFVHGDVHWVPYHYHCWPCFFYPDFIGHFETIKMEADYVIDQLYPENRNDVQFPQISADRVKKVWKQDVELLSKVRKSLLRQVIAKYQPDMDMFGYKIDPSWT